MRAKNWKFYYKETEYESFFEKMINALLQWASFVMLWASFWSMVKENYPTFIPDRKIHLIWGIWTLLLWVGYVVLLPRLKSKGWRIWALSTPLHILIFLIYYAKNHTIIWQGLLGVANRFLSYYNFYYQTNYYVVGGVEDYGAVAFTFVVFLLWYIQWNLVYLFHKKWLFLTLPVLAFVLDLLVGHSPYGASAGLFFLAALIIVATQESCQIQGALQAAKKRNRNFSMQRVYGKAAVLFFVVFSLLISNLAYQDELALLINQKSALIALQDRLFQFDLQTEMDFDIQFDKEKLDNNKPRYLARKFLTMVVDKEPSSNIYLKGYNGNIYEDSVWSGDYSSFLEACKQRNVDPEKVAKTLFQSGYEQLDILPNSQVIHYSIQYEQRGNKAYVPYFTDYDSLDGGYSVIGDYLTKKGVANLKMTGIGLDVPGFGATGQYEIEHHKYDYTLGNCSWYKDVMSDIYTDVPSDLWLTINGLGIHHLKNGQDAMEIAEGVKAYLADNMNYSMELDKLSEGEDPIQYFLTQSKEGYCMHFASAGVMMLRYLGVPARYVSGYVILQSSFYETQGGYVGVARDRNAHAWVEIFVEGIGWLPVEMTPGYEPSAVRLPTESQKVDTVPTEKPTEEPTEIGTDTETETDSVTETESQNTSQAPQPSESETEKPSGTDTEGTKQPKPLGNKTKELLIKIWPVLSAVLGVVILLALIYLGYRRWILHYHRVLEHLIEKKQTRQAVRKMHRRIYRYLRLRKGSLRGLRDDAMEELLIATYPILSEEEWRQYMEIAKKMYFSKEEISEEEMMHCYHCYKLVTNVFFKK